MQRRKRIERCVNKNCRETRRNKKKKKRNLDQNWRKGNGKEKPQ